MPPITRRELARNSALAVGLVGTSGWLGFDCGGDEESRTAARIAKCVSMGSVDHGGNVVDVEHLRDGIEIHVRETAIKLVLQTRGSENSQEILDAARAEGFSVRVEKDA